jgi:predicted MFS family arabinose efflux permease
VSLIAQKEILRPVIATALIMASFGGAFVLLPYYLEYVVGLSTGSAGALLMAASVTMLFSGLWGGTASDKGSLRKLGLLAAGIALLAYVLMSTFGVGTAMVVVILALILLGWGTGSFLPVNNRQVLARVPMDMQGVGSSTVGTIRVVGQTMGVAVMATVFQSFLVGHPNVGDVASGFAAAMLLGIVMVAIALLLVWFTTDPERKEGEKIPVL